MRTDAGGDDKKMMFLAAATGWLVITAVDDSTNRID